MNPNFIKSVADRNGIRNEYLKNLQLETSNNLTNYNANQIFKQTGQLPPSITALVDTRSITEKYADKQKARIAVLSGLREITDGANANSIIDQIQGNDIIDLLNNLPQIIAEIKPKWSLGITAPAFMSYWNSYKKALSLNAGVSSLPVLQSNQILTNIQGLLQNIQNTIATKEQYDALGKILGDLPDTTQSLMAKKMNERTKELTQSLIAETQKIEGINDPIAKQNRIALLAEIASLLPTQHETQDLISQAQIGVSIDNTPSFSREIGTSVLSIQQPAVDMIQGSQSLESLEQELVSLTSTPSSARSPGTTQATETTYEQTGTNPKETGKRQYFQGTPETYEQWENMKWDNKLIFVKTIFKNSDPRINWGSIPKPHSIKHLAQSEYNPGNTNSTTKGTRSNHWIGDTNIEELMEDYFKVKKQGGAQESKKSSGKKPKPVYIEEESEEEGAEPTAEDIRKATTGTGIKKKHRIQGRGINAHRTHAETTTLTSGGNYRRIPKVDTSHKVEKVPSYIEFGKHLLHQHNLLGGILQIRRHSGNIINELPRQAIGGKLKNVLIKLTGTGSPSFEDINELSTHEKEILNKVVKHCKIDQRLLVPTPDKTKEEQDMNRLQILSGEITAGQNNPQVVRELKTLLLRLKNSGRIPKREAHEIMEDLLTLGY
jgi:hypothetical protein